MEQVLVFLFCTRSDRDQDGVQDTLDRPRAEDQEMFPNRRKAGLLHVE